MGDILFIGGDRRMICAAELISQSGGVCAVGLDGDFPEPENQSGGYERIVLPVPFSRAGENITAPHSESPREMSRFRSPTSQSMHRTRFPSIARAVARAAQREVFPVPPFPDTTAKSSPTRHRLQCQNITPL